MKEYKKIRAKPIIISRQDRREKQEDSPEKDTPTEITQPVEYVETILLGKGGFGRVYAGYVNDMKVAIKHIPLDLVQWVKKVTDGKTQYVPLEAMLMKAATAGRPVGASAAVSLLDWQIKDNELILIMERPYPCCDLMTYVSQKKVILEKEAQYIMHQLVLAAANLHAKGVFHRDIKLENILIETTLERRVRIIDFGCGTLAKEGWYKCFAGTWDIWPPECQLQQQYRAVPFTVWQLGVVLYELLGNDIFNTKQFLAKELNMNLKASKDCQDFMDKCLCVRPEKRPDFEQLLAHPWLQFEKRRAALEKSVLAIEKTVATEKVADKLSSTLSWVKNSVSYTVSQMASQVATPTSLQTTVTSSSTSLSSPALSPSSPPLLSPDDVELLAKLEEQNSYKSHSLAAAPRRAHLLMSSLMIVSINSCSQTDCQVATEKVADKLSSTLSWVKNSVSYTVSQMASQVATPTSLQTTVTSSSTSLSSPALSPSSPPLLSPDDVELLAKLEEQNSSQWRSEDEANMRRRVGNLRGAAFSRLQNRIDTFVRRTAVPGRRIVVSYFNPLAPALKRDHAAQ
ncbi:serine/threonine-protein kinase ULK3-like [Thalassophryne amazonica]|uniref:serine/threonine-protein kinase ULK3-like n=1 Tax=Thalassophryne amazonica TaxID=390379 RepID=UPI001471C588|nr:serine/threonine-protein kinase ULK3-like [Thalassophryne amazonica]